ncbi:MAG: hypothetical protein A2W91_18910 [Bacteroidetes bacterium GWF2_38_335]|nr:MAG: hypothetical protein A2W91_18910 [Bacteroidetes bacterium GWF2_38_335]OFY80253.1 MAG: hypothetical protein A2281_17285 [Bacteroidetes bacterium RIFOXYA12_FULL_38_20]HBS88714.1 DUF454 domain-containing protein [Bacteroidales bacterium]
MTLKLIFILLGTISLVLGIAGIFIPGLPTTPFLILTAGLYYKGSERFYNYLISNKLVGSRIKEYKEKRGIPVKTKVISITIMWIMIGISSVLAGFPYYIIFIAAGCVGTASMIVFIPVIK